MGRPVLLAHWRVPVSIWAGLPLTGELDDKGNPIPDEACPVEDVIAALDAMNDVSLTGFDRLNEEERLAVAEHVRMREHHAKVTKTSKKYAAAGGKANLHKRTMEEREAEEKKEKAKAAKAGAAGALATLSPKAKVPMPKAGVGGVAANSLAGKTFVLTGVFDEVPGGVGLAKGKGGITNFIASHGGKVRAVSARGPPSAVGMHPRPPELTRGARRHTQVTGSVSKKTSYVVCGTEPGGSKVSKALANDVPLVSVQQLCEGIKTGDIDAVIAEDPLDPSTFTWSAGFGGNGLGSMLAAQGAFNSPKKLKL